MLQECDRVLFAITDIFIPSLSLFFFSMKLTKCWHLWCFQPDTLQWTGNSEDSDKATAAQAGGEKEELFTQAAQEERRGKGAVRKKERNELLLRAL